MREIKKIVAANLIELRKINKYTQLEIAERFNYSDKAVSKWERGEALPDLEVLVELCDFYQVDIAYLLTEQGSIEQKQYRNFKKRMTSNQIIITCLAVSLVWIISTLAYVYSYIIGGTYPWILFVWSIPLSTIVLIVFNGIWGRIKFVFPLLSLLIWSLLVSFYLHTLNLNLWLIFILGVPIQIAIILWSQIKRRNKR